MTMPLPPQDPREPDEALPGETELAALYRQLPQDEPGPALDAAVLREAAQALAPDEETPTVRRERRKAERERGDWVHPKASPTAASLPVAIGRKRPRWLIALSSAATLVFAAGLAWHMRQPPVPESPSTTTGNVASPEAAAAPAPRMAPPRAARPSGEAMPPPPPPEPPRQSAPRMVAAQPALAPAVSRKATADRGAEGARSAGYLNRQVRSEPMAAPTMLQETAENPAAKAAAAAMPAAAPAAPVVPVAQVAADAADASDADTPARQLDSIRQLFAQHRDDEARQQLEAFHRIHPTWELPPELRAQLRKP